MHDYRFWSFDNFISIFQVVWYNRATLNGEKRKKTKKTKKQNEDFQKKSSQIIASSEILCTFAPQFCANLKL